MVGFEQAPTKQQSQSSKGQSAGSLQEKKNKDRRKTVLAGGGKARFKKLSEDELQQLQGDRYTFSTKKNTKWAIRVFNAWCAETLGKTLDLGTVSAKDLNIYLCRFYAEAAPKPETVAKRTETLTPKLAAEYHRNSLKNVRAALNRHLKDINSVFDIVRDKEFSGANRLLSNKMKADKKQGVSHPEMHFPVIMPNDLHLIKAFLQQDNPLSLRFKVWFDLSYYFLNCSMEFYTQLKIESVEFCTDQNGKEYVRLSHEILQNCFPKKTFHSKSVEKPERRMYATGDVSCPVKAVHQLIFKSDPLCTMLFNVCDNIALSDHSRQYWYRPTPVNVKHLSKFMPDICKNAGCRHYTAQSVRLTALQAQDVIGFQERPVL